MTIFSHRRINNKFLKGKDFIVAPGLHVVSKINTAPEYVQLLAYERERLITVSMETEKQKLGVGTVLNKATKRRDVF